MYLLSPLNHCCNTPHSIKHGPFVGPDFVRQNVTSVIARSGSIYNRNFPWRTGKFEKTCVIAFAHYEKKVAEMRIEDLKKNYLPTSLVF
jgi:hypothetical protein